MNGAGLNLPVLFPRLLIGLALPRYARVEVETRIDAHPATVFALVNDFHRVALWSPWLEADPNARVVHSGPVRGVGAMMTWDGAIIGTGTQTITESRPFAHVATTINPGESGEARAWFDLEGGSGVAESRVGGRSAGSGAPRDEARFSSRVPRRRRRLRIACLP